MSLAAPASLAAISSSTGWLNSEPVVNLDALTYAGNRENLATVDGDSCHVLVHGDISDFDLVSKLLAEHQPRAVINFSAESHVDCYQTQTRIAVRRGIQG